jgi:hypothetical protein
MKVWLAVFLSSIGPCVAAAPEIPNAFDRSFDLDGFFPNRRLSWLRCVQPDGQIIAAIEGYGTFRLRADGSPDPSFHTTIDNGNEWVLPSSRKWLLTADGGFFVEDSQRGLLRLNGNGTIDESFQPESSPEINPRLARPAFSFSNGSVLVLFGSIQDTSVPGSLTVSRPMESGTQRSRSSSLMIPMNRR